MLHRKKLERMFRKHGFEDFRWIDPKNIEIAHWVRMKCLFGCNEYGKTASCPPHVPPVYDCERFFREYREVVVFHFEKSVAKPEDRFAWTRKTNILLLKLEKEIFLTGYPKAFLLFMDSCNICAECSGSREACKEPKMARPTPESLAVDVFSTVRKVGYSIEVLSSYAQKMNRYAFLLIE